MKKVRIRKVEEEMERGIFVGMTNIRQNTACPLCGGTGVADKDLPSLTDAFIVYR